MFLPKVDPADVEVFRSLMPSERAGHQDWLDREAWWRENYKSENPIFIPVKPSGFKRYLEENSRGPTTANLIAYAEFLGGQRNRKT